jgi:hypothetical protein
MARKRGPKTHWTKRVSYQRKRCISRLKFSQIKGLFDVDAFSRKRGFHLNTFLTVTWRQTDWAVQSFEVFMLKGSLAAFRNRLAKWLRAHEIALYWIYVPENPSGNLHTHFLIHIPTGLRAQLADAIDNIARAQLNTAVDVQPRNVPGNFQNRLSYMCKGTDFATARLFHLGGFSDQGDIDCKRCGWTENLGLSARKRVTR